MSMSRKTNRRILSTTAALAIICASSAADAQNSYDAADPVVVSGNVTFDRVGTPNTETYTINSNTAVLDFLPNDMGPGGPINFQFAGTIAQYLGGLGITDFTVLNRIFAADPSRAVQFNGTVISRLQGMATAPGGSVWFYSPGGIVVGSTAVFDVGNLLLAAGDPTNGSGVITDPNQFTINSVPDSNAAITVQAGAQISATNSGSYVALVAPAIRQSGTVSTNGSAAYVAAESTTLTFNSGLFNITTAVGSNANSNTPLVHDGTTRFVDDAGPRRAYLVSVAKNDAITMLIEGSGQLGFDTATGVNIDNGVVVLSGGFDVNDTAYTSLAGSAGALRHDIQITSPANNANILGQVNPFGASEIRINSQGQAQRFAGDVSMNAGSLASITNTVGGSVDITGDLDLSTLVYGARDIDFMGGSVLLDASLGNISIGGNTSLTSFADADFLGGLDPAGTVQGGTIAVIADNGNAVSMLGNLDVQVEANGADQLLVSQTSAGNAVGGNIFFSSSGAANIAVGGVTSIANTATGGTVQLGDATAGNATGGIVNIVAADGDINFGGNLAIQANGIGGQVNASGTTAAGEGIGGQVNINVASGDFSVGGNLTANVDGFGGSTQFATSRGGGDGSGGSIIMSLIGIGNIAVANDTNFSADGTGSNAVATGNDGGSGVGGNIFVLAQTGAMSFGRNVSLRAGSFAGSGFDNTGVASNAGALNFQADGGSIDIAGQLNMNADAFGGSPSAGQDGADAFGGSSILSATNSGTITVTERIGVTAGATGGASNGGLNGRGGNATGGNGQIVATTGGAISVTSAAGVSVVGAAVGAGDALVAGTDGGDAFGGTASISQGSGGTVNIAGNVSLFATASGGTNRGGGDGIGGNATGGDARLVSNDGSVIIGGNAFVTATATGGGTDGGIAGGSAFGGLANIGADTGLTQIAGSASVNAGASGGNVISGTGNGGNAAAGSALIGSIGTGTIELQSGATVLASASGGGGLNGNGGNALAGAAQIFASGGGLVDITGTAVAEATGNGGSDGGTSGTRSGGDGQGGTANALASNNGTIAISGGFSAAAQGVGGSVLNPLVGDTGGNGTGGIAQIAALSSGSVTVGASVFLDTNGFGGAGDIGGAGIGGGRAQLFAIGGATVTTGGSIFLNAMGQGGTGISQGGDGTGGFADVSAADPTVGGGTITIGTGTSRIRAVGGGGGVDGSGGTGGNGFGGFARIFTTDGSITFNDDVEVVASANGGNVLSGTGNGGDGTGGTAQVLVQGPGVINALGLGVFSGLRVATSGFGGTGTGLGSSSGDGTGGISITQALAGGTINIAGGFLSTASGFANNSFSGQPAPDNGGNGIGGRVFVLTNGGTINGTSTVALIADGQGSDGVLSGGDGTAGQVVINASIGLIDFSAGTDDISLSAFGTGGNAVAETDGAGNVLRGGGEGGDAIGGSIFLVSGLAGAAGNGELRLGNVAAFDVIADPTMGQGGSGAIGGRGADGAAGQNGGNGGDASSGVMYIGANAENGVFQSGNVTIGNIARAGSGGLGGLADGGGIFGNGGNGGDASGRTIGLGAFTNIGASTTGSAQFGDIIMNIAAIGGSGGNAQGGNAIGGTGGDALAGAPTNFGNLSGAYIIARAMPVTLGDASLTATATGGDGGLNAAGTRSAGGIAEGLATSISAVFGATDNQGRGSLTGNNYIGRAISKGGLGAGDIRANSFMGASGLSAVVGDIQLNSALLETRGIQQRTDIDPNEFAPFTFVAAIDGIVNVNGDVIMLSDNEFNLLPIGSGEINIGGNLAVTAGAGNSQAQSPFGDPVDAINIGENVVLTLGGDFIFGGDIDIAGDFIVTANGLIQTANITSGSGIALQSGSTITTGNLLAADDISITGMADELLGLPASIVTGNIASQNGLINVATNIGDITLGNLISTGGITINAGGFSTSPVAGGDIVIGTAQGSDLNIRGTDNLTIGDITVVNALDFTLIGAIDAGNISAGNDINLTSNLDDVTAGSVQSVNGAVQITAGLGSVQTAAIAAANNIIVDGFDAVSISGNATAGQLASFTTGGTATFGGLVEAMNINVTSSDIDIGTNGGLGGLGTNDLEINALGTGQPITFGGDGTGGGYNLSAAEATKLRSRTIRFNAQQAFGTGSADITIDDFTLDGSLAGSSANLLASQLDFNTPGTIRVVGAGLLNNAGTDDRIALFAGERIEVVTDLGGSLRMRDAMGNPGGTLFLSATNIAVGTDSLLSQLAADPRFAGRDDVVNGPDGSNMEGGYIEANFLDLAGGDTIIIQNSNTAALRGGFTAGTAGVLIGNFGGMPSGSPVDVVINGRVADGAGGYLTNEATRTGVMIEPGNSLADFSPGSTVNGCLLSGGVCDIFGGSPVVPNEPEQHDSIASDVREIIHHDDHEESEDPDEEDEKSAELTPGSTGKKSPIAPKVPVVSTKRLNTSPVIEEPVTGSGNPNLIGGQLGAGNVPDADDSSPGGR